MLWLKQLCIPVFNLTNTILHLFLTISPHSAGNFLIFTLAISLLNLTLFRCLIQLKDIFYRLLFNQALRNSTDN